MFAALQKASKSSKSLLQNAGWNWAPVSISEHLPTTKNDSGNETRQTDNEIMLSRRDVSLDKNDKWFDIPLSSDDEDHISPRGVLQFRKISCSETSEKEHEIENDDHTSCIDTTRVCQQQETAQNASWQCSKPETEPNVYIPIASVIESNANHQYMAPALNITETKECGDAELRNKSLQSKDQICCVGISYESAHLSEEFKNSQEEMKITMANAGKMSEELVAEHKCENSESVTNQSSENLPIIKLSCDAKSSNEKNSTRNRIKDSGTQTIGGFQNREEFTSTKMALQRQLTDALSALDLTRNQANALRDRLRTYTSSMRQQAGDLRASSRSLNHTLDKVKEYKTNWKTEKNRREVAEKRVCELEIEAKDSEKILKSKMNEIYSCNKVLDYLGKLLNCDDALLCQNKTQNVLIKVQGLLELVDFLQTDASLAKTKQCAEVTKTLEKFEEEKKKLEILVQCNTDLFTKRLQNVEKENSTLHQKLKNAEASCDESKCRLTQALQANHEKNVQLNKYDIKVKDLEQTISDMQMRLTDSISTLESSLKKNENLHQTFRANNEQVIEDKRKLETAVGVLQRELQDRTTHTTETGVQCDFFHEQDDKKSGLQSPLRSSCTNESISVLRKIELENERLTWDVKQLDDSIANLKHHYFYSQDENHRLSIDFRHLNRTCHEQQVFVQNIRSENESLNRVVQRLQQTIEVYKTKFDNERTLSENSELDSMSESTEEMTPTKRCRSNSSRSNSLSDTDARLETIIESPSEDSLLVTADEGTSKVDDLTVKAVTSNTAIVRPYKHTSEILHSTLSTSSSPDRQSNKVKQKKIPRRRRRSKGESSSTETSSTQRSRLSKNANAASKLPLWRQENPENQFSLDRSYGKPAEVESERNSSSDEDVFICSHNSLSTSSTKGNTFNASASEETTVSQNRSKRLIGIPMQEDEFQRLLQSSMSENQTQSWIDKTHDMSGFNNANDSSRGEETLLSLTSENSNTVNNPEYLHSTLLFPSSRLSSMSSESKSIDEKAVVSEKECQCFLEYRGATFDALTFSLTQMRQIAWEVGCSESNVEMNTFIDFLAEKANELDNDPRWRGKHSLGKSSDWLELKGLF